jgi:hypothetical protein
MIRKFGVNVMGKGLKIKEGSFINLDSIDRWEYGDNEIEIRYANRGILIIGTLSKNSYEYRKVEASEFDRIIKELKDYMGL